MGVGDENASVDFEALRAAIAKQLWGPLDYSDEKTVTDKDVTAYLNDPTRLPAPSDLERYEQLAGDLLGDESLTYLPAGRLTNHGSVFSDETEARLRAVVCNRTRGMDAGHWNDLSMEERTPWMKEALGHAAELPSVQGAGQADETEDEWSDAKSPAEWESLLRVSATTRRRHVKEGKLIVDKTTPKLWRIRKDSLRRYRGK
jgi:hypothetical protein